MTIKTRLLSNIARHPGWSAYQHAVHLHLNPADTSSVLCRLSTLRDGVYRVKGHGPKGGFGYYKTG